MSSLKQKAQRLQDSDITWIKAPAPTMSLKAKKARREQKKVAEGSTPRIIMNLFSWSNWMNSVGCEIKGMNYLTKLNSRKRVMRSDFQVLIIPLFKCECSPIPNYLTNVTDRRRT